jgi:hypothetical protein
MSTRPLPRWWLTSAIATVIALIAAGSIVAAVARDDRAAGGRLAASAAGAPWPRLALDRDAHARRYAGRLGLSDGMGGVFTDLLDREAWAAIDAEVAEAQASERLRTRLRGPAIGALVALALALVVAVVLAWRAPVAVWRAAAGLLAAATLALAIWAHALDLPAGISAAWR